VALSKRVRDGLPAWLLPVARRTYHAFTHHTLRLLAAFRLPAKDFGRLPNLAHPQRYSDKIRWRLLYDRRPLLRVCSDRLASRDYVAARAGEKYLVPLLGVFDRPEHVPWGELVPPYVVKATHGCGWNIFVRDSKDVDPEGFERTLEGWLKTDFYHVNREWSYKHVPRRIMVESFIGLGEELPPDFKFYCFDGEPKAIGVCYDRYKPGERWTWRDPEWNTLTFISPVYPPGSPTSPPSRLAEMLEVARAVSHDFDHVRVDLYCVGEQVYFGELTPTQATGRRPFTDAGEAWMGAFWQLPSRASVKRTRRPA
jgi:hypothetical protein